MAVIDNPALVTRYTDTVLNKRVIGDRINMIDPMDTKFLDAYGLDSARAKFDIDLKEFGIEWIQDQYRGLTGTLSATLATGATAATVSDASVFKLGDIIILPNGTEYARITAVPDITNNTLAISKAYDGTTDATQATGTITILTEAQLDNTATVAGPLQGFTTDSNFIQIFRDSMTETDLSRLVSRYGITDSFQYQLDKKMPELMRSLERAVFRNLTGNVGSASAPPHFKGLLGFVTTNTFSTTQAGMLVADIETNIILPMQNAGSMADEVWCNHKWLQTIKNIYDNSGYLRVERTETSLGMLIKTLVTPWGDFRIQDSRWCQTGDVFFLDSKKVGLYEYQPFYTYDLPGGNYEAKGIQGAYSLVLANETAHGRLHFTA